MSLQMRDVTRDNWLEVLDLRVHDEQAKFTPAVYVSMAKIHVKPDGDGVVYQPFALYAADELVGFLMLAHEPEGPPQVWLNGFLIDHRFQGRGYGKAAVQTAIRHVREQFPHAVELRLTVYPDNARARKLYQDSGFRETDERLGDEILCRLPFTQ